MKFIKGGGFGMANKDSKFEVLKEQGVLNFKAEAVKDELFQRHEFFDARDLLQVKYEMVRRVKKDRWTVTETAETFGFSRPSFYKIQMVFDKEGLAGLIPQRRGPKGAHKLSEDVIIFVEEAIRKNNTLRAPELAALIKKHFNLKVHSRSIERALKRREKK